MPETTETPTVETPAPATPPASGMARFMADVTAAAETPEPPKPGETTPADPAPDKPKATTPPPDKSRPVATKPAAKPDAAKPGEKEKVDGIDQVRSRLKEVQESEKTIKAELETLRKEREELSKRKFITPEIEAEIEQNRKEAAELRRQLSESAYERSPEFRKRYVEPFEAAKKLAIETATQYPVLVDADGNTRPATAQDFYKVAAAPRSERAEIARRLFGDNAFSVLSDVNDLEKIKFTANQALQEHGERMGEKEKEEQVKFQEQNRQLSEAASKSRAALAQEYPDYFAEIPDDPESNEAWKKGQDFVDAAATRVNEMNMDERAAYAEVVRARASWFPRGVRQVKNLQTKVAELEAELAKFRGGDPGNGGERQVDTPKKEDDLTGGTDSLIKRFEGMGGN